MRRRLPVFTLALALVAGDGTTTAPDLDAPLVATAPRTVALGAPVPVEIANLGIAQVEAGACNGVIERQVADRWVTTFDPAGQPCILLLRVLRPGDRITHTLPAPSEAGTYRARHRWWTREGTVVESVSNPFEVGVRTFRD